MLTLQQRISSKKEGFKRAYDIIFEPILRPLFWIWKIRWPVLIIVVYAEIHLLRENWSFIHSFLMPTMVTDELGNRIVDDKRYLYVIIPFLVSALPAYFIWLWRDQNKRDEIENARDDISLKDFHQIQQWAVGLGTKETLQVAAIYQLRDFLVGEKGDRFVRPTWELFKSILNEWEPEFKEDSKDQLAPYIDSHPKTILDKPRYIEAIHTLVREESVRIKKYYNNKINFEGTNLSYADLEGAELQGARLSNSNLEGTILSKAWIMGAQLTGANLKGAKLDGVWFYKTQLSEADLAGANLYRAQLDDASFINTHLEGADFNEASLIRTNFLGAYLKGAGFYNAFIRKIVWVDGRKIKKNLRPEEILVFKDGTKKTVSSAIEEFEKERQVT